MNAVRNTFIEGMDQDTSLVHYKNTKYWRADNMRIFSSDGESVGSIQNEKGNTLSFKFPESNNTIYKLIGDSSDNTWAGTIQIGSDTLTIPLMSIGGIISYLTSQTISALSTVNSSMSASNYGYILGSDGSILNRLNVITIYGKGITTTPVVTKTSGTGSISVVSLTISDQVIIGYTNLRDRLIVFTTDKDNTTTTPSGTYGCIWSIRFNSNDTVIDLDSNGYLDILHHLVYYGELNFSIANKIKAEAYYFNDVVGKVYWTDGYNQFRHINIFDKTIMCLYPDQLNTLGNVKFSQPLVTSIVDGGSYKSGVVQYAYQLYNLYGSETSVSPTSYLYNLSKSSYTKATNLDFVGNVAGENTGKAVMINIPYVDDRYDHIRLFSLFYGSIDGNPIVRIVVDKKVVKTGSIDIIDDGLNFVDELSYQEFSVYDKLSFSCKDLVIKDKRMIVSNIDEERFDVDYDARAYRHNSSGYFNIDHDISGEGDVVGNATNWALVDEYADAICKQPDLSLYKYCADGTTVGGEGVNVSYVFSTNPIELASDPIGIPSTFNICSSRQYQSWSTYFSNTVYPAADNKFTDNPYYSSYASPINSGQLCGYRRGETYRMGVIFYNSTGQRSPVKWIGDIKFPEAYETGASSSGFPSYTMKQIQSSAIPLVSGAPIDNLFEVMAFVDKPNTYDSITISITYNGETKSKEFNLKNLGYTRAFSLTIPTSGTSWVLMQSAIKSWILEDFDNSLSVTFTEDIPNSSGYILLNSTIYNASLSETSCTITTNITNTFTLVTDYSTTTSYVFNSLSPTVWSSPSNSCTANILFPVFTLTNIPLNEEGNPCSYEIVRVNRSKKDQSILTQGLLTPTMNIGEFYYPVPTLDGVVESDDSHKYNGYISSLRTAKIANVISPEINFKDIDIVDGDGIVAIGSFGCDVKTIAQYKFIGAHNFNSIGKNIDHSGIIDCYKTYSEGITETVIGGYKIKNTLRGKFGSSNRSKNDVNGGTSLFVVMDDYIDDISTDFNSEIAICNITRSLVNQYGGNSFYSRQNNIYQSCNAFVSPTATTSHVYVFGGDTYISYFEYLRGVWNDTTEHTQRLYIPLETNINIDYRIDLSPSKQSDAPYNTLRGEYAQEYAGDYSGSVGGDTNYTQSFDMYLQNSVYQKSTGGLILLPEAPDTEFIEHKDAQIYISEEFNYDDKYDNLVKFLPENNTIIDTSYGPINALVSYSDYLYIFQDKAIGVQFVNERTVINDTTGSSLAIGSGDVAGRFQYISTSSGCKHKDSIVAADSGLYYFDANNKSIYIVSGQNFNLTKTKGLSSYFNEYVNPNIADTACLGYGIHGVYDNKNSRILWSYLNGSTNNFTIGYSEVLKSFESFYDYIPYTYLKTFDNMLLSVNRLSQSNYGTYMHDVGDYGLFYDSLVYSKIQLVVNDNPLSNKQFASIEFPTRISTLELKPGVGVDTYYNETINNIIFSNNYQTTGTLSVVQTTPSVGEIKVDQHLRKWRIALPRVENNGRQCRISDTYLNIEMQYLNNGDKKIALEDIITYYTLCVL